MLKNLLNKLEWDKTMAVVAFAEAGDFSIVEKALARDKRNLKRKSSDRIRKPALRPARG